MTNYEHSLESLLQKSHDYLETRIDLVKLKTIDKSSDVLSSAAVLISILIVVLGFISMVSMALALYLGHLLGKLHYGFFIMAGFYGLVILLLFGFRRKWIKNPIYDGIVKKILN